MGSEFSRIFEPLTHPITKLVEGLVHFVQAMTSEVPAVVQAFHVLANALQSLIDQSIVLWAAFSVVVDWAIYLTPAALAVLVWGEVSKALSEMKESLQWGQRELDIINGVQTVFLGALTTKFYLERPDGSA